MWHVVRNKYDQKENYVYETLFTLANGYLSLRGTEEFSDYKYKGTYIAGLFNKSEAQVPELVNFPDPLLINFYVDNVPVKLDSCEIIDYERKLNMKEGFLQSLYVLKVSNKLIKIESTRFVSRWNIHRAGIKYKITPLNFSGKIIVENGIDTKTFNGFLEPINKVCHYNLLKVWDMSPGLGVLVETRDKGTKVAFGTRLIAKDVNGENALRFRKYRNINGQPLELYTLFVEKNESITLEKYISTYNIFDNALSSSPCEAVQYEIDKFLYDGFDVELSRHVEKFNEIWKRMDIEIDGDELAQIGIRFNLFHLYACAPDNPKVSIGARGLHGEGYKGHVFWDTEIFMFPFFLYTLPEYAKNLLLYRYNTLDGARKNAQLNGYKGAQFPWESADDGVEVTPKWGEDYLGNPVRIWTGDEEFHINSDIAVALVHYHTVTGDDQFMCDYGVEILLETGKFWASRVEYNSEKDRYEINNVIGPDEFHEHVKNNVYTNYLAKWNLLKAVEYYYWIKEKNIVKFEKLKNNLGLTDDEVKSWESIAQKIYIPRKEGEKLIEQFEGYFELEEYEITEWDENGLPKWPKTLDLTKLGQTKLIKQPDVVMLMLVLPEEFDLEEMKLNYEYYEKRTMHKSSLSPSMYSIMGLRIGDTQRAYKYFMKTVLVDLEDNQGNTNNGFHAASAGGAWQSLVYGFGGVTLNSEGILEFSPWLPERWKRISFNLVYKNFILKVTIKREEKLVLSVKSNAEITVKILGEMKKLQVGENVFYL